MILYFLSFIILFCAEICQTLHSLCVVNKNKQGVAFFGALSSALWCIKIVVVVNQPLTIITAFIGAYVGSLAALYIDEKLINRKQY